MESYIGRSFDSMAIKRTQRKRILFVLGMIGCIAACMGIFYFGFHWFVNRQYTGYTVVKSVKVKEGKSMEYAAYEEGVLHYDRDGITAVDSKGNPLWSGSYEMANPKVDTCGASVVVADVGEKSLYAYKGEDTGTELLVDYPIVQACISKQGVVAVLTEEKSSNTIALYNPFSKNNKLLAEIPTNVEDGYPVSLAISPDGSSVVASYLCVTTGTIQTKVVFYNFSEVGKNANYLVGAHNYNDTMISQIRFLGDSAICLFGEKGFYLWENAKQPKAVAKKLYTQEIQSAFVSEKYVGVVVKGQQDSQRNMCIYDTQGKRVLKKSVSGDYTQVQMRGEEVLFYSTGKCFIYRINGVKKWQCNLSENISYLFPSQKNNRYFMIQDSKIKIIKLK